MAQDSIGHAIAIAVAPNGGRRVKADHRSIPLTPRELAETAARCREAGAAMIHMHVRDRDGGHLLDPDAYRDAIAAIRGQVADALVIQITSESLGRYEPAEQMAVVREVRPEAVSLALRELCPVEADEVKFAEFISWLLGERCMPQIILYAPEEARRLGDMARRGVVPADLPVLYVLGRYVAGQRSAPSDLLPFLDGDANRFASEMVCAFGPREIACVTAGALLGCDCRVGFENNLHLPDGQVAPDNAALVEATRSALVACGLELSDAGELRQRWARAVGG